MVLRRIVGAISLVLILIASVHAGQQAKTSALEGVWVAKSIAYKGQVSLPPEDSVKFTFTGEKLAVIGAVGPTEVMTTFTINDAETPKRLDFPLLKTKVETIFKLENDSFTLAVPRPGSPRPKTFEDPDAMVYVFARGK
jgi:uncharacterized protein (TIGR03067 family)